MKKIPVCSILGVHIAAIDMKTTLDYIQQNIRELKGKYICVSNVHTTVMSYENDEYRNIQNSGALGAAGWKTAFGSLQKTWIFQSGSCNWTGSDAGDF